MSDNKDKLNIATIGNCLAFFRSVIICGEPWTDTCLRDYKDAQAALSALAKRLDDDTE